MVVLIDEIDALYNQVLISVLRQLRSGFNQRPTAFPSSVALIGLRDVRDYKVKAGGSPYLNTPSPFNISVRSFTLRNFTAQEVRLLLGQHTAETGQRFTAAALDRVFELTLGQPWLVNALAKVCVEELVQEATTPVEVNQVNAAKEILILQRQTHLGQLTDKLREERVRRVIEPILAGGVLDDMPTDDREYVIDLGSVRRTNGGTLTIANPIYGEVIPRTGRQRSRLLTRHSPFLAQPRWLAQSQPTAGCFSCLLAPTRTTPPAKRTLPRGCPTTGDDGILTSCGQWQLAGLSANMPSARAGSISASTTERVNWRWNSKSGAMGSPIRSPKDRRNWTTTSAAWAWRVAGS